MMNTERREICRLLGLNPPRDENYYWRYFTEIDSPEEWQLHKAIEMFGGVRWFKLLLQTYPIEANYQRFSPTFSRNRCRRRELRGTLRKLLNDCLPTNLALLGIIARHGGKRVRRRARELIAGQVGQTLIIS
jgi:hypothetical protein